MALSAPLLQSALKGICALRIERLRRKKTVLPLYAKFYPEPSQTVRSTKRGKA